MMRVLHYHKGLKLQLSGLKYKIKKLYLFTFKARLHYAYFKRLSLKAQTFGRQSSFLYYHCRSNRLARLLQEILKRKKMELLKRLKSS